MRNTQPDKEFKRDYEQRIQSVCLLILTAIGITGALYWFSSVLIPFVLAIFLTICLGPVIELQVNKLGLPRRTAVLTTILAGCVMLILVSLLVTAAVNQILDSKDQYQTKVKQMLVEARDFLPEDWVSEGSDGMSEPLIKVPADTIRKVLTDTASSIMGVISNGLLVMIFMIFMVAGKRGLRASKGSLWQEVEYKINRYVLTMVFTSGITGILVGLTLTILGVDFGWMFGFLAFLLNFIPNIGSIIAVLLPLPVAFIDTELGMVSKILVIVIPGIIQFCIGNLLQPKLMGQSLNLHPVVILLALIFFGTIWGIMGMFLATPITAVVKMLFERFEYTKPIAELMAGKIDILTQKIPDSPEQ